MKTFEEYWKSTKPKFQTRLPVEESVARRAWDYQQKEIDQKDERIKELEKENRKLTAAFHQMKNNAKQLFDMSNRFNSSIESNLIMAKDWCDDLCGTKDVSNEDV